MSDVPRKSATPRLSEAQVRERLGLCTDPDVVGELYDFGLNLSREGLDQIKTAESKATSFAAYGTAIATLLVSSAGTWSTLGNSCTFFIVFLAGFSALVCTYHAVRSLLLTTMKVVSEEDWLKADVLEDIVHLKSYRVLALWQVIDSRIDAQRKKARRLISAQVWLTGAVAYLVSLLFQIALKQAYLGWIMRTHDVHWRECWQRLGLLSSRSCGVLCGLGLILLCWCSWRSSRAVT
jgi:hypothetical protein